MPVGRSEKPAVIEWKPPDLHTPPGTAAALPTTGSKRVSGGASLSQSRLQPGRGCGCNTHPQMETRHHLHVAAITCRTMATAMATGEGGPPHGRAAARTLIRPEFCGGRCHRGRRALRVPASLVPQSRRGTTPGSDGRTVRSCGGSRTQFGCIDRNDGGR